MATIISHNIISPLGETSEENYAAVSEGRTALRMHSDYEGLPFSFYGAIIDDSLLLCKETDGDVPLTRFERMAMKSIRTAISGIEIDPSRTILLLSSTKINVSHLNAGNTEESVREPGKCAQKLSDILGLTTVPITICNACISGVAALIAAQRLVDNGDYDYAIVCGADEQSPFVISGFESFHSLSESECRPFDIERTGLNLGEAAATIVIGRDELMCDGAWRLMKGCIRNDAYHMSTPHPQGEGARLALNELSGSSDAERPAVINAHGTATMYNDQMESKAIVRAGLQEIPVNAYKAHFGHTMGAAGVIETILTIISLEHGVILPTRNFSELGVSGKIKVVEKVSKTNRQDFIKMISGFGGCNGAIRLRKTARECNEECKDSKFTCKHENDIAGDYVTASVVKINPREVTICGEKIEIEGKGDELISEIYRNRIKEYPKFHKMDSLAKLAFAASELLLQNDDEERFVDRDDRAVVLFNTQSTLHADRKHAEAIADVDNFFPSPSVFLYTLPNVASGEIALRNKYRGETGFYLLPGNDKQKEDELIRITLMDPHTESIIFGSVYYENDKDFEAELKLIKTINN